MSHKVPFYTSLSEENERWVRGLRDELGETTISAGLNRFIEALRLSRKGAIEIIDILEKLP